MKWIYWKPHRKKPAALLLMGVVSVAGLACVECLKLYRRQPHFQEKLAAAQLALRAMEVVKAEQLANGFVVDPTVDPIGSCLIGSAMTPVTTNHGSLSSKQTSINPNFAAVVVEFLRDAGVSEGDVVAVGCSGSFPAINIGVFAAIETLDLKPIVISSAAASQWGANDPDWLWIDMERAMYEHEVFGFRSVATSLGGIEDRCVGMPPEAIALLNSAIERNGLFQIEAPDFERSLNERMALFREHANGSPFQAYINVGGGTVSVGTRVGKRMFQPGLNTRYLHTPDSVMTRFIQQGIPVIHLTKIEHLANRYGLPLQPTTMPAVGEGGVYFRRDYHPYLTSGVLILIALAVGVLRKSGRSSGRSPTPSDPFVPVDNHKHEAVAEKNGTLSTSRHPRLADVLPPRALR